MNNDKKVEEKDLGSKGRLQEDSGAGGDEGEAGRQG